MNWKWFALAGGLLLWTYRGAQLGGADGSSTLIDAFAYGIALAEGFFVAGSRPQRNHNPGDLTADTTGKGIGRDGSFVVYGNDADGWEALHAQVGLMFSGSHIYDSSMTLWEIAQRYTQTDARAWAMTVASQLGVSIDTKLSELQG